MLENFLLKTPVYITDEGPEGAIGMFLLAVLGLVLFLFGRYLEEEFDSSCLAEILTRIGIASMLTGVISGIISLL